MKILVIEDDAHKADRIENALHEIRPHASIDVRRSYQSGLRMLESQEEFDVVVLDMSLPTFDPAPEGRQGRQRPLGGYELMRKLRRSNNAPKVIVLTALENFGSGTDQITLSELSDKCADEFPSFYLGAIYYSQSSNAWERELIETLSDLPA